MSIENVAEELSAEDKNKIFIAKLSAHIEAFQNTANGFNEPQATILFCSSVEQIAGEFKEIFIGMLEKEMLAAGKSKSSIRKLAINLENSGRGLLKAHQNDRPN